MKQMRIEQSICAMKVSTDACIQGAWTPIASFVKNVLDIGTGTGLLSLMLAQRSNRLHIDAIEIDENTTLQAKKNIQLSPFEKKINVVCADAKLWQSTTMYDLIICNPPFFSKSLKGENQQRNNARHNDCFSQNDLCKALINNLADNGYASILLPISEQNNWLKTMALNDLYLYQLLLIKPFNHSSPNRAIFICQKTKTTEWQEQQLVIYEELRSYTDEFKNLLHPFYLNL